MAGYTGLMSSKASERNWIFVPDGWRYDQKRRGIIWCHGGGQDATVGQTLGPDMAAKTGMVTCSPDLFGTVGLPAFGWANASQLAKITAQWDVLKNDFKVKPDKVILMGLSMGTATALVYTLLNPGNVAALELELPAVSIDDIHDNDRLGMQSEINDAYGGSAAWEAAKATRDPFLNMGTFAGLNIPIQMWYGQIDNVCLASFAEAFAAAVPSVEPHPMPGGHDIAWVNNVERVGWLSQFRGDDGDTSAALARREERAWQANEPATAGVRVYAPAAGIGGLDGTVIDIPELDLSDELMYGNGRFATGDRRLQGWLESTPLVERVA